MRTKVLVVLLALVAMAVAPPEAVLADSVGSVVGQVASCTEASGLVRDAGDQATDSPCDDLVVPPPVMALTALAAVLLGVHLVSSRRRSFVASGQRWRLADAASGQGAPWRAPPLPV